MWRRTVMKSYLDAFMGKSDETFLKTHTIALMEKELKQTTPSTHEAADYMYNLIKECGFDAERVNFVADGKTACHDNFMPLCWDATCGRLTVVSDGWDGERLIADYEKEPFSLIRFSVATPEGGLCARLVTWEQMQKGVDATGAFVTVPQGMLPKEEAVNPILNSGAIGIINGTVWDSALTPDAVLWANNCSETISWYVNEGERDFVGFCVSPRMLKKLEDACEKGEVILKAETDGHRYVGEMPAVTALLKGESEKEFWVMAHTAEPLEDDNNAGVVSCIHSMCLIRDAIQEGKIPPLKYSVRFLFAPERYGFAAFADKYGPALHDRCIGAFCVDGMPIIDQYVAAKLMFSLPPLAFYGNVLLEGIWDEYRREIKQPPFVVNWYEYWGDDCFMSDASAGLPTVMAMHEFRYLWHCSVQRYGYINYELFARVNAVFTAFIASVAAYDGKIMENFLPRAVTFATARIADVGSKIPQRNGSDAKERVLYRAKIEIDKIKSFKDAGVSEKAIKKACKLVEKFAKSMTPVSSNPKTEPTPVFDSCDSIVPERLSVGIPHDFTKAPLCERYHLYDSQLLSFVFSLMDGKKTLKTLITETEYACGKAWSEEEIQSFVGTIRFLEKYRYIKLK